MSELALFKGGLPSYLQNVQTDDATNALAGGELGARRLSIKGNVFREYIGGKEYRVSEERSMNVVIVKAAPKVSRLFYAGAYVEGESAAPACWSSDGQRPDAGVAEPQASTCMTCPKNIKGSGNGESRACSYKQYLAVVVDNEIHKEEVYQLVLPPTSVFGDGEKGKLPLQAYARHLKNHGTPITGVVTEMRFDTSSPTPKLIFKPIRPVTEEEFETIQTLSNSRDAINAVTLSIAPKEKKPALGNAIKAKAVPVEVEEVEEPKKAVSKKASAATASSDIADLVGEWDD
jgi:hypothetical protein